MKSAAKRLSDLEAELGIGDGYFREFIHLKTGSDPLPSLLGKMPGLYLFLDAVSDGAVFLGRVARDGRASIKKLGGHHATH